MGATCSMYMPVVNQPTCAQGVAACGGGLQSVQQASYIHFMQKDCMAVNAQEPWLLGSSDACMPRVQRGALSAAEVCEALGMSQLKGRKWHVQAAVAIRGEGLYEGLDWCGLLACRVLLWFVKTLALV